MENINHKEFGITEYQFKTFIGMILEIIKSSKDLEDAKSKIEKLKQS